MAIRPNPSSAGYWRSVRANICGTFDRASDVRPRVKPGSDSRLGGKSGLKRIGKPDSVMACNSGHSDHSSTPLIAQGIERPYPRAMGGPPNPPIWPCTRWGLPSVRHHWRTGELLPRLFNLTRRRSGWRYVFCGTFPRSLGAVVNGHPVLWSPDFPPLLARRRSLDPL